ncbi:SusD-like starch-binding protein associating with outer membrane [Mucilaginibacter gracilis]|uniref:SusD-like starch-binding protein associating with outer membrane n=1 Tax=Mucilaginibacter gracilis TaxID=423350 RepID=A0A495IY15_9SPHI|nr:RagB/SusD family nutrient uptake outer membrane protein [Mucilaginibacter gracilis]RKR81462.1 SusD-like starch-binding protein associating with outer membrane [Mucilaginibacter gracilis]
MKKIYITLPLILALVTISGCKKFLETAPDMRTQLTTPAKVGELLVTAYTQADYATFTDAASDNAEDKGALASSIVIDPMNGNAYLWQDVQSKDPGSPTYFWNASYAAIAAANAALKAIAEAPDQTPYLAYKGEALVARAYAHFMLAIFFAKLYDPAGANDSPGIPYVTTPETVVFGQYSRGTVASTWASIEADLLAGLPLIKDVTYSVPKYHFTTRAADAFAARFYLFKKDYAKVISYTNDAFPNNTIATYLRPWNTTYKSVSADALMVLFTQASQPQNLLLTEAPSVWARNFPFYRYGMGLTENAYFNTPLPTASATVNGLTAEVVYYYNVPNYTLLKFNELFVRANANATIGTPYTIMPQFTTDEMLMERAEAYANLGQSDLALADINTFLSTRLTSYNATTMAITYAKIATAFSTTDVKQGLIACILDFKKREFMQEGGVRWFDEIRLNLPVTHNIKAVDNTSTYVTLPAGDPRRLFQLPAEVTLSGVAQNPR